MTGINRSDDTTLNIRVFSIYSHSFLFSSRRYLSYIIKMIKFADDFFLKLEAKGLKDMQFLIIHPQLSCFGEQ